MEGRDCNNFVEGKGCQGLMFSGDTGSVSLLASLFTWLERERERDGGT